MDIFLTVISFPFWAIGMFLIIVTFFGTVTVDGVQMSPDDRDSWGHRTIAFIIGGVCVAIAATMTGV